MLTIFPAVGKRFHRAAIVAAVAALSLAACGGGSGYGSGYNGAPIFGNPGSKLFAADSPHMAIGSLANPNPAAGTLTVDRIIQGSTYTGLSNKIGSLALDTTLDYLYVGNGSSILVFYGASMATGDVTPARSITGVGNTGSMFLDTAHDLLYVGDDVNDVKVFSGASTASGTPTPRHITVTTPIHGVAVDAANNILYVSNENSTTHQISVFDNADTVTTAAPNRTITPTVSAVNQSVGGISLDAAHDVLYVAGGSSSPQVMVFSGASTANDMSGASAPGKVLTFPAGILNVVVDSTHDRLYAIGFNGHIYLVEAVSTLSSGAVTAKDASLSNGGMLTAVAVNPN